MKIQVIQTISFNILELCEKIRNSCEIRYSVGDFTKIPIEMVMEELKSMKINKIDLNDSFIYHLIDTLLHEYLKKTKIHIPKKFESLFGDKIDYIEFI